MKKLLRSEGNFCLQEETMLSSSLRVTLIKKLGVVINPAGPEIVLLGFIFNIPDFGEAEFRASGVIARRFDRMIEGESYLLNSALMKVRELQGYDIEVRSLKS